MANKRKILKSQSKGELTFRTVKTKLNGRTYYRGVLEPRPVMTTEQFAECLEELGCQVKRRSIEMVLDYIRDYAPEIVTRYGGRVQVGPFTVYPALMGRFAAEDSEFDPKTNRIAIKAKTRMSFKYETGGIRLRNAAKAATEQPALVNAFDATTQKEDGVLFTGADAIAVGDEIGVDAGKSDEGVTLKKRGCEDAACAVKTSAVSQIVFEVPDGLKPGTWQLEIRCRARRTADAAPYKLRLPVTIKAGG